MNELDPSHRIPRTAGVLLTIGSLGFVAVFAWLAAAFGYADVLDLPASEVLPSLLAGGHTLRAVWVIYAVLPLSLASSAWLARGRLGLTPAHDRFVSGSGVLAGLAMTVGLARWPTLQWALAERWAEPGADHSALSVSFDQLNLLLGNIVGEALGELSLAVWLLGIGWSRRANRVGQGALLLATLMVIGSARNVLSWTDPATEVTNYLLPTVLLWLGVVWTRGTASAREPARV